MSKLVFSAVQREALWSEAAEQLKGLIRSRALPPGSRLPSERELCRQLGMSRVSLREALRALEYAGYLAIVPGRGIYVREASEIGQRSLEEWLRQHDDLVQKIFEFRELFEPGVAQLAAERASSQEIEQLAWSIAAMRAAWNEGDLDAAIAADAEFHHLLVRITRNDLIVRFLEQLLRATGEERRASLNIPGQVERAIAGHAAILEAIRARDPDRAGAAMRQHLRDAWRYIAAWLAGELDPVSGEIRESGSKGGVP
ncbi:FadR/GntR family transcriptional regulator [Thermomicrobium sp.]